MKRRSIIIVIGALAMVCAMWWLIAGASPKQVHRFSDGTVLSLEGIKIGRTNEFLRGSYLERVFGRLIPTNGLHVLRWTLQRPARTKYYGSTGTRLSAEFKLSGAKAGTNLLVRNDFFRQFRTVVAGNDGFEYVSELWELKKYQNDYYGYLDTSLFPRDSRQLRIRIERRDTESARWQTVAEFTHRQAVRKDEVWTPEPTPATRTVAGRQFNLGEITVRMGMENTNDPIWNQSVFIPWQLMENGEVLTNWNINNLIIRDASGNEDYFGTIKKWTNGWNISRIWRSADPGKVWKLQGQLSPESGFPASNVFTIQVPYPLAASLETNVGGFPFRVEFMNVDMLTVSLLATNRTDRRLIFLRAEDRNGKKIDEYTGNWSQFRFSRVIKPPSTGGLVTAIFAVAENIPFEFTVKPRFITNDDKWKIEEQKKR